METATQTLHRLTSFEAGRKWHAPPVDDPRVLHIDGDPLTRFPWPFKRYADSLPRVRLPRHLPRTAAPAVEVLAGTADVSRIELDLAQLSRLLHLSAGVVRTAQRASGGTILFRAAGSAGGRFPLEIYVVVPAGAGVPAGVHWYDPLDHALVQVGPPPRGEAPALVVTGVPWRTCCRYFERGYRHLYWDAGTTLSQILAVADSAGIAAHLYTRFADDAATTLVGADGVHEWPVALVSLGDGAPALDSTGSAVASAVDAAPVEFPLVTAAQRAGDADALGPPWGRGAPVDVPSSESKPMEDVVLARSSQRRMDSSRSLPETRLRTCMETALRGVDLPHRVVVHNVDGLEPGLYRWPDLSNPVRAGTMQETLYRLSLEQDLACDAAFVVIAATDIGRLGDREYREAHLGAGLVEGRLHLVAYALGASASGMGFLDSEVPEFLDEPLQALLFTCVGVGEYTPKPGGSPGAPTAIRQVAPRLSSSTFTPPRPPQA